MISFKDAFQPQIESTPLLTEADLADDDAELVVWNQVSFAPQGNFYSSGKEMHPGDTLLTAYLISEQTTPKPFLMEKGELEYWDNLLKVVRVYAGVPVLCEKNSFGNT